MAICSPQTCRSRCSQAVLHHVLAVLQPQPKVSNDQDWSQAVRCRGQMQTQLIQAAKLAGIKTGAVQHTAHMTHLGEPIPTSLLGQPLVGRWISLELLLVPTYAMFDLTTLFVHAQLLFLSSEQSQVNGNNLHTPACGVEVRHFCNCLLAFTCRHTTCTTREG